MDNEQIIALNKLVAYAVYLPITLALTWYVAHSLFKNSVIFMKDIFNGRDEIALATNTLFKMGFYLLNVGFALFILKIYHDLYNVQQTIETLSYKIGGFSIYLGCMLLLNLFLFFRGKRIAKQKRMEHELLRSKLNQPKPA